MKHHHIIPYPTGFLRWVVRLPILLHRLGLGWLVNFAPVLILTTRGRKSGQPRYAPLEYRRHGNKVYLISMWGERPDWVKNLHAYPGATVTLGHRSFAVTARPVEDRAEMLLAVNLFRRAAPIQYLPLVQRMNVMLDLDLHTLTEIMDEFTVIRLDVAEHITQPALPPIMADRVWVLPALLATGVIASAVLELLGGRSQRYSRQQQKPSAYDPPSYPDAA